jgi:hypothetical protein
MMPLIRQFLPGVRKVLLYNNFGTIVVETPFEYAADKIVRQLSAVPFFERISYWLMIRDTENVGEAVQQLTPRDIVKLSKLVLGSAYPWVLLDASWKPEREQSRLPETEFEIEHILHLIQAHWRHNSVV